MKKILVTGITGFAGSHLAEYLVRNEACEVVGTYLSSSSLSHIDSVRKKINLHQIDLSDSDKVAQFISSTRPDAIFHLAALPSPAESFKTPSVTLYNNIVAELNLLEAVKNNRLSSSKILIVSSAEIYGMVTQKDLPINESTPLRPLSPYAVSKITQDFLGLQYFLSCGMNIVRVRPFNHVGPRQSTQFVVPAFAKQIAEIEKGKNKPVLKVGNLEAKRDFTDVNDMVKAYSMILEQGDSGEVYNIGSGKSLKIEYILNTLLALSTISIKVVTDPELLKPSDVAEVVCDNTKIYEKTGWQSTTSIGVTLKNTLDYWRNIV